MGGDGLPEGGDVFKEASFAIETKGEPKPASYSRYQQWRELPLLTNVRSA